MKTVRFTLGNSPFHATIERTSGDILNFLMGKDGACQTSFLMDQDDIKAYFLQIYDAHADALFRFCRLKVDSAERAEDLTQEVFMRFWQALSEGTVMKNDRALLYTIARNLIIDWYRKKKEVSLDVLTDEGIEFADKGADDVVRSAEGAEALRAVAVLDEPSKEAVLLRYVEGLSPQEIGELTGESANVISVRLNRAIKKLRGELHVND